MNVINILFYLTIIYFVNYLCKRKYFYQILTNDSYQILYAVYFYPDYTTRNTDIQCYNSGELFLLLLYRKLLGWLKIKYSPQVFLRSFLYLYSNIILTAVFFIILVCTNNVTISVLGCILLAILISAQELTWYNYFYETFLTGTELLAYLFLMIGIKNNSLIAIGICGFFLTINFLFKPIVPIVHLFFISLYLAIFFNLQFIITLVISIILSSISLLPIVKLFCDIGFWYRKIIRIYNVTDFKKVVSKIHKKYLQNIIKKFFTNYWLYIIFAAANMLNLLFFHCDRTLLLPMLLGLISALIIIYLQEVTVLYYTFFLLCMTIINSFIFLYEFFSINFIMIVFISYLIIENYTRIRSQDKHYFKDYRMFNNDLLPLRLLYNYIKRNTTNDARILMLGFDISIHIEINRKSVTGYLSYENYRILKESRRDFFITLIRNLKNGETEYIIKSLRSFNIDEISKTCGYRYLLEKKIGIYEIYKKAEKMSVIQELIFDREGKPNIIEYDSLCNYEPYFAIVPRQFENYYSVALTDIEKLRFILKEFFLIMKYLSVKDAYILGFSELAKLFLKENDEMNIISIFDKYKAGLQYHSFIVRPLKDIRNIEINSVVIVCTSVNKDSVKKEIEPLNQSCNLIFLYEFLEVMTDYIYSRYHERRLAYAYKEMAHILDYIR
ncbi:MAG: hypothetical protein AB1765_00840 [Candidatus Hydrogenedentota bacterium]